MRYVICLGDEPMGFPIDDEDVAKEIVELQNRKIAALFGEEKDVFNYKEIDEGGVG